MTNLTLAVPPFDQTDQSDLYGPFLAEVPLDKSLMKAVQATYNMACDTITDLGKNPNTCAQTMFLTSISICNACHTPVQKTQ